MLRSAGGHFPRPSLVTSQTRHAWNPYIWYQRGTGKWWYPDNGQPADTQELRNRQYYAKSREQWDYQRINEYVTNQSEFTKMDKRPDFDGPREASYPDIDQHMYKNPPSCKRLYEYFDEYTAPGVDKKVAAAVAVKEQWDSENFYYPGESWQRNRPSFRSVPKEMLNKQTCYYWLDTLLRYEEFQTTSRPRTWNPIWPPPGYKVPKLHCTREFMFGVEEPGLVHEVERWYWHRMWFENNVRHGLTEYILFAFVGCLCYYMARVNQAHYWRQRVMFGNMWYPGRNFIRCFGEPRDAEEGWWWQRPLEDKYWWPEQGLIWWMNEVRFGYINYERKEQERKQLEAAL